MCHARRRWVPSSSTWTGWMPFSSSCAAADDRTETASKIIFPHAVWVGDSELKGDLGASVGAIGIEPLDTQSVKRPKMRFSKVHQVGFGHRRGARMAVAKGIRRYDPPGLRHAGDQRL